MYVPRNPYFSEFSYGYAVTEDLISGRGSGVTVAPVFPSLVEEGQVGFDVLINQNGIPLFIQFKLAHRMERNSAAEAKSGYFVAPFYRMYLRCSPESDQHALLLALESAGERVLYTAPAFHLASELNEAYRLRQVWNRSFQVKPSEIGVLPPGPHHVSFQKPGAWYAFSSEPRRSGKAQESSVVVAEIESALESGLVGSLEHHIRGLDAKMVKIFGELKGAMPAWEGVNVQALEVGLTPLQRVSYLARSFFDCQFFVAVKKTQSQARSIPV